ncbi:MAG TPA: hypothetical protein VF624_13250 [Tepidisphaeraceae bacterium]
MTKSAALEPMFEQLEDRRLMAVGAPLSMNFNDEALWEENFSTAVSHAKALGVKTVRIWIGLEGYDQRPRAYDPPRAFGSGPGTNAPSAAVKRAFELDQLGFSVMLIVNERTGAVPATTEQARALFGHLMTTTETPTSTVPLKDVVDYWEIGNEVDQPFYWAPAMTNRSEAIRAYVNKLLIPAADVLHAGAPAEWEKVVSAGMSWNPADVNTALGELKAKGRLDAVDYAGFHPYGAYDPTRKIDQVRDRTASVISIAGNYGKKVMATEWNVTGFAINGSQNTAWAKALDDVYRNTILPEYELAFYFALVNNDAARGASGGVRPAGLLKHTSTAHVSPTSSVEVKKAFYVSPLVPAEPFYGTFKSWSAGEAAVGVSGRVSGVVSVPPGDSALAVPATRVYLDLDRDAVFDPGEPTAMTGNNGAYTFAYGGAIVAVTTGQYDVRLVAPAGWQPVTGRVAVDVADGKSLTANMTMRPATPTAATGAIVGKMFAVSSGYQAMMAGLAWTAYVDANANGRRDTGERSTQVNPDTTYALTGLAAGTYRVGLEAKAGWIVTTPAAQFYTVALQTGAMRLHQNFVVARV